MITKGPFTVSIFYSGDSGPEVPRKNSVSKKVKMGGVESMGRLNQMFPQKENIIFPEFRNDKPKVILCLNAQYFEIMLYIEIFVKLLSQMMNVHWYTMIYLYSWQRRYNLKIKGYTLMM